MLKQTILTLALISVLQTEARQGPLPYNFWQKMKHFPPKLESDERISCGQSIDIAERPFHAFVLYYGSIRCSASIITPNAVMTSGSCCQGMNSGHASVRVGSSFASSQGDIHDVQEIVVHPNYDDYNIANDICLLILKEPVTNPIAKPVSLPTDSVTIEDGATLLLSGLGITAGTGLVQLEVSFVSDEECFANYGEDSIVADSMLCAIDLCDDLCNGHIGAPLTYNEVQVGIGSWGYGCANPNYPSVFTQVDGFLDFISENTL